MRCSKSYDAIERVRIELTGYIKSLTFLHSLWVCCSGRVNKVYEQHPSTPPKPSTNMAVQHPHPCDETPVGAGGGGGGGEKEEEEERKEEGEVKEKRKSKWWQRLHSFFRAAKKHPKSSSGQGEVEQQQQDDGEKRKVAWAGRSSDGK
ncbi:hypothetical protein M9458_032512 [Cirrhinus mrigala]|uniref:Uncharacterized protein n=1 Tax=Cirrhinus mrigala TaxID=683832 RepID=A0ABD0PHA1_CIRMR